MREIRALLIRALFSHLLISMHQDGWTLMEQAATIKLLKRLRAKGGYEPMSAMELIDYLQKRSGGFKNEII